MGLHSVESDRIQHYKFKCDSESQNPARFDRISLYYIKLRSVFGRIRWDPTIGLMDLGYCWLSEISFRSILLLRNFLFRYAVKHALMHHWTVTQYDTFKNNNLSCIRYIFNHLFTIEAKKASFECKKKTKLTKVIIHLQQ
jgi:hypothetical protein